ncbi:MAG TPA: 6-bladed beta-propeller [Longimicrobium sp.]|nr:6-bladed beta-propeller [Longimicrobium sp.]
MRPFRPALALLLLSAAPLGAQLAARPIQVERGAAPRLQLTEVFRVGSLGGRDAFGRVMDATLDNAGRLLVADDQNHHVVVFGRDGRFVGTLGRQGNGPGEMQAPWLVVADAHDSIFVYDNALARISVFTPGLRFARSFPVPPQWLVNTVRFLPDGRLLVAAYGRNEPGTLHVLTRTGQRQRTFGPRPAQGNLAGFEASLLGGNVDVAGRTIVYSVKSPYEVWFFDLDGRVRGRCAGPREWTTDPRAVLRANGEATALEWPRFVHSANVVALSEGLVLNEVLDPGNDRATLDLVTGDCRLLRRTTTDPPMNMRANVGRRMVGVRNLEYPEVVVYERRIGR